MSRRSESMKSIGADNAIGIRSLIARKNEKQKRLPRFFFSKRGHMNLRRDASQHRRFAYLYEDMLT